MWCSHEMVNRDGTYKNNNNFTPPPFISSYKLGITAKLKKNMFDKVWPNMG
jgi:hypothetical protein